MITQNILPKPADGGTLRLLVAMPALNEDRTVGDIIRRIPREIPGISRVDVLVIDDGSTDQTADKALQSGAQVIKHGSCQGVGAAFHTALAYALEMPADILVTIDSDGQFDPASIPLIVEPIVASHADFVTASRFKDPALVPDMPAIKKWGNRAMSRLISRIAGRQFYDVSCGMRCYSREAILRLTITGTFTYTQEVLLNLSFKRLRIEEVPVPVRGIRKFGKSRIADNLWHYGMRSLGIILRCYRDYRPMHFFSRLAFACIAPGLLLELFMFGYYIMSGMFSPYKWAGFSGTALIVLGLVFLYMGLIGDMLDRHRTYLEEMLYMARKNEYGQKRDPEL